MNSRLDIIILGRFFDNQTVGIYALASQVSEGIYQISFFIRNNVDPILGEAFYSGNMLKIKDLSISIRKFTYPLITGVIIITMLVYPVIVIYFLKYIYFYDSIWILLILLIGIGFSSGVKPFGGIFLQADKPGFHSFLMFILVMITAVFNIVFIYFIGIYGAAIAMSATYLFEMLIIVVFSKKMFNVKLI